MTTDTTKLHAWRGPRNGPPLVLLHGLVRQWRSYLPLIPHLEGQWELHAPDHRGHGQSPRAGSYRVVDYVRDAAHYLETELAEPAVVYGHSLGAMTALAAAAAVPRRVRAVVLEDPPFQTMGSRIASTPLLDYFRSIRPLAGSMDPVPTLAKRLGAIVTRDPTTLRFMARCLRQMDPAVLEPVIAGEWLAGYDVDAIAAAVKCPVLLFQSDPALGGMLTEDDAAHLESLLADCTRVYFPGFGHQLHWTATANVVRQTLEFLAALD